MKQKPNTSQGGGKNTQLVKPAKGQTLEELEQLEKEKKKNRPKPQDDRLKEDTMKNLLSTARSLAHKPMFLPDRSQKLLEFSHLPVCSYNKHAKAPKGCLLNMNTRCFTSWNERGMIVWNPETLETVFKKELFQDSISCVCYSKKYHLYFVCTRKLKIKVLNEYLNTVVELPIRMELIQKCIFIDETKQLLTAGMAGCYLIDMKIDYDYDPRQAIMLDPKGNSLIVDYLRPQFNENGAMNEDEFEIGHYHLKGIRKWAKGIKLIQTETNPIIITWNIGGSRPSQTYFYEFTPKERPDEKNVKQMNQDPYAVANWVDKNTQWVCHFDNLTGKDDFMTDIELLLQLHYMVISTNLGRILIYKWYRNNRQKKFVHEFKNHSKPIMCLNPVKANPSYIVSASLDGSVKIFCLEMMIELYSFQVSQSEGQSATMIDQMENIQLIDDRIYAIFTGGHDTTVEVGTISHLVSSFFIAKPKVLQVYQAFDTYDYEFLNQPDLLVVTFDDNSIMLLDPNDGRTKSIIYPPPSMSPISTVLYNKALKRVFVLLQNGSLCVYRVQHRDTATLEKLQTVKSLRDYEGHTLLNQTISIMYISSLKPPQFDCDIFADVSIGADNKKPKIEKARGEDETDGGGSNLHDRDMSPDSQRINFDSDDDSINDNFLVFGLSKGVVIYVRLDNLEYIYARFSVHRQAIIQLQDVRSQKLMISMCSEFKLGIWGFENQRLKFIQPMYQIHRPLKHLKIFSNFIYAMFDQGESIFFTVDKEVGLKRITYERGNEHEDNVVSCDVHKGLHLIVTADTQGLIKIWNFRKELIREIRFYEGVATVSFMNQVGDILVGHNGQLSKISVNDFSPGNPADTLTYSEDQLDQLRCEAVNIEADYFLRIKEQGLDFGEEGHKGKSKRGLVLRPNRDESIFAINRRRTKQAKRQIVPGSEEYVEKIRSNLCMGQEVLNLKDLHSLNANTKANQNIKKRAKSSLGGRSVPTNQNEEDFPYQAFNCALKEATKDQTRKAIKRTGVKISSMQSNQQVGLPHLTGNAPAVPKDKTINSSNAEGDAMNSEEGFSGPTDSQIFFEKLKTQNISTLPKERILTQDQLLNQQNQPGSKTRSQMTSDRIQENIKFFNRPNGPDSKNDINILGLQLNHSPNKSEREDTTQLSAYFNDGDGDCENEQVNIQTGKTQLQGTQTIDANITSEPQQTVVNKFKDHNHSSSYAVHQAFMSSHQTHTQYNSTGGTQVYVQTFKESQDKEKRAASTLSNPMQPPLITSQKDVNETQQQTADRSTGSMKEKNKSSPGQQKSHYEQNSSFNDYGVRRVPPARAVSQISQQNRFGNQTSLGIQQTKAQAMQKSATPDLLSLTTSGVGPKLQIMSTTSPIVDEDENMDDSFAGNQANIRDFKRQAETNTSGGYALGADQSIEHYLKNASSRPMTGHKIQTIQQKRQKLSSAAVIRRPAGGAYTTNTSQAFLQQTFMQTNLSNTELNLNAKQIKSVHGFTEENNGGKLKYGQSAAEMAGGTQGTISGTQKFIKDQSNSPESRQGGASTALGGGFGSTNGRIVARGAGGIGAAPSMSALHQNNQDSQKMIAMAGSNALPLCKNRVKTAVNRQQPARLQSGRRQNAFSGRIPRNIHQNYSSSATANTFTNSRFNLHKRPQSSANQHVLVGTAMYNQQQKANEYEYTNTTLVNDQIAPGQNAGPESYCRAPNHNQYDLNRQNTQFLKENDNTQNLLMNDQSANDFNDQAHNVRQLVTMSSQGGGSSNFVGLGMNAAVKQQRRGLVLDNNVRNNEVEGRARHNSSLMLDKPDKNSSALHGSHIDSVLGLN